MKTIDEIIESMRLRHSNQAPHLHHDEKALIAEIERLRAVERNAAAAGTLVACYVCGETHFPPICEA